MYEKKKLARKVAEEIFENMDYEFFLNIFKDKYNWFACLGISEDIYEKLAKEVNLQRTAIEDEKNKTKILIK